MRTTIITLFPAVVASMVAVHAVQPSGNAKGTLTVGATEIRLAHAYAFTEPARDGKEGYRILLTDRPLTPAALTHAAAAGTDEDARQALAVELAAGEIRGIEALVGADQAVTRMNIYSADSAMGMMLLTKGEFQATTFDAQQIAGRLSTAAPIQNARIGKTVQYDVTFAASIKRAAAK